MTESGDSSMQTGFWDTIDKIYCISVDTRTDRRESAMAEFRRIGILPRVEFLTVSYHPEDREQGIYESHLTCMRRATDAEAKTIAIFEDDILFDRYSVETLDNCANFMKERSDWDILFLGCMVSSSRKTGNKSVLKIRYRCLAHGYVLTHGFARKILSIPWRRIPLDGVLKNLEGRYFAAYPSLAFQSNARTDNLRCLRLDRFRRIFGGLRQIQKMNEVFYRHRPLILSINIAVLLLLLFLLI